MIAFLVVVIVLGGESSGAPPRSEAGAADEAESHIDAARSLYRALRYRQARERAEAALQESGAAEPTLVEAHVLLGSIAAIEGEDAAARTHFAEVLERQPGYALPPSTSPKIAIQLERARALVPAEASPPIGLSSDTPSSDTPSSDTPPPESASEAQVSEAEPETAWAWWAVGGVAAGAAAVVVAAGLATAGATTFLLLRETPCEASLGCATAP